MDEKIFLIEYRFVNSDTIHKELKTAPTITDLFYKYSMYKNMVEFSATDITYMSIEEVGERING